MPWVREGIDYKEDSQGNFQGKITILQIQDKELLCIWVVDKCLHVFVKNDRTINYTE